MRAPKSESISRLYSLYPLFPTFSKSSASLYTSLPSVPIPIKICLFCSSSSSNPKDSAELFRRFGCSDAEISKIFNRQPSLLKAKVTILSSKLSVLLGLGITSSDLVKIVNCRPRFFANQIVCGINERLDFFNDLFGQKDLLLKAIIRNPSILHYNLNRMKSCVSLYKEFGISKQELAPLLISRPLIIPASSLNHEKREFIRRIGISNNSKMYKYIISLIAISRLDTVLEKATNLENVGLSGDQVMSLFRQFPTVLTLSVDKVQRNMTFVIGTLKLPATVVLKYPFLVYVNLESVVKPRYLVGEKIISMGLLPQLKGPLLLTALRMTEPRFLKVFITCHSKDVADELMKLYANSKGTKRLAETSRQVNIRGFPF